MKGIITAIATLAFVLAAGVASAADVKGVIKSINGNTRMVNIDGVQYYFPSNVDMNNLAAGQTVTVTYTVENARNQVSKVGK
jgi:hypothetical protein